MSGIAYIPLTQGRTAVVDPADFEWLSQWKWHFDGRYARRSEYRNGKPVAILMHRAINQTPDGFDTDHTNGDKLDNRRENLRSCLRSENMRNRGKAANNKSGFKGVRKSACANRWLAQITHQGKVMHIGSFQTPEEAHAAYMAKAKELHGEFFQKEAS